MGGAGNWLGLWLSHFLPLIAALGEELLSGYFWFGIPSRGVLCIPDSAL